jgi:hypothetical protein
MPARQVLLLTPACRRWRLPASVRRRTPGRMQLSPVRRRKFEMRLTTLLPIVLLAVVPAACAPTVTLGSVSQCARLVSAAGLLLPTPPASLPAGDLREWQVGFVAQSGQLDKANDDKAAASKLMVECEALHQEALDKSTKPWWRFWE